MLSYTPSGITAEVAYSLAIEDLMTFIKWFLHPFAATSSLLRVQAVLILTKLKLIVGNLAETMDEPSLCGLKESYRQQDLSMLAIKSTLCLLLLVDLLSHKH